MPLDDETLALFNRSVRELGLSPVVLCSLRRGHIDDDPRGKIFGQVIMSLFAPPWKHLYHVPQEFSYLYDRFQNSEEG